MQSQYTCCKLCPRACKVDRNSGQLGFCGGANIPEINKIALHFMEEPVISGDRGSGTVFFTHCTLGCIFCQNRDISRKTSIGKKYSNKELAEAYIRLQGMGAHNINLVSPTHYLPSVIESIKIAKLNGLTLPIVYNTGGFERAENIAMLKNVVDIFLTDIKYYSPYLSGQYSGSEDYFDYAQEATDMMVQLVGEPKYSADGIMTKGVIIRHLMLPGQLSDTISVLRQIAKHWGDKVQVSLMRQYTPMGKNLPEELCRTVTDEEYSAAVEEFELLNLSGYLQDSEAVGTDKIPSWEF